MQIDLYFITRSLIQCGYYYRGHPDKVNQSQSRKETIDFNIFNFSQSNAEYRTMKFQLVRSPRKQIDTDFGCKALSFQLISIVSLLNLGSCDSNILKVNISDVYERVKEKFETGKATTVPLVLTVAWRSSLVTVSSFLYAINWSFGSTIWKINTSNASEGRLSSWHNLPVKAKIPTFCVFCV